MSVHRNDLGTEIFSFEELLKLNPVQASIQGGWVLNLDYRWNLKPYDNFQNNPDRLIMWPILMQNVFHAFFHESW